jgi:two-component system response regulator WspF
MDPQFATSLAEWLSQHSAPPVRVAVENDRPVRGGVLMAGTQDHLYQKAADRLGYTPEPRV